MQNTMEFTKLDIPASVPRKEIVQKEQSPYQKGMGWTDKMFRKLRRGKKIWGQSCSKGGIGAGHGKGWDLDLQGEGSRKHHPWIIREEWYWNSEWGRHMENLTIQTENVEFPPLWWHPDDVIKAVSGTRTSTWCVGDTQSREAASRKEGGKMIQNSRDNSNQFCVLNTEIVISVSLFIQITRTIWKRHQTLAVTYGSLEKQTRCGIWLIACSHLWYLGKRLPKDHPLFNCIKRRLSFIEHNFYI